MLTKDVSEAVAMVLTGLDALAGISGSDWESLPLVERLETALAVETARRQGLAVGTTIASTLIGDGQAALGGGPAQVLADWLRITTAEAKRRFGYAEKLQERTTLTGQPVPPQLPATAQAWRAGTLDVESVKEILDFHKTLPAGVDPAERDKAETFLAREAAGLRPDQVKVLADSLALTVNPDGVFTDADRRAQCGFTWSPQRRNGMRKGVLWADPELQAEIDAVLAQEARPGKNDPADETACTDGEPDPEAAARDSRTQAQRNHDGFKAVIRRQLGDPKLGQHRGLPVTVIASTTVAELEAAAGTAITATGTRLDIPDLIRMARHAVHYLTVFDDVTGRPLWLGRTRRCASADQRIVLHALDRGCTFPGCNRPGYQCEVHHVDEWAADGRTDIDKLTFACQLHHRLLDLGWRTRKLANGDTEWLPPAQLQIPGGGVNTFHHPERYLAKYAEPEPVSETRDHPG